jgi:diacylglycerol kinase
MSEIADTIRRLFVSFRDSVGGLFDSYATADDLKGILWLGLVGVVLILVVIVSRAVENRRR